MDLTLKLVVARNKYFSTVIEAKRQLFSLEIYKKDL
jgi:hypothetical protein